ncbi:MAG TPA: hypothetical protein DDX72_01070, partial [Ruminococcaceae bacterium]|nr:hypothetical protein [Oscillospiraceae bacterium]
MKKTKQILSVFLSVCMIISCMVGMSVTAGAVVSPSVSQATSNLSGDGNVTAGNFYQDFVEVSEEEAKAWTGAPAEDSFLIYKISGNDLFYIFFNNGAFDSSSFFSATIDSFNYLLTVNKMYYTTGSGSSTPATTNVSFVRAESVQDLGTNLPNIPTYTKEQAEAWIAANKAELMAEHQARLAITKDESFFIVVYSKNGSTYNHIHYRHNDPTWSSPQYRGNYTLNMYKDEMNDYGAIVYYPGVAATPSTVAVTDVSLDKTTATLTAGGDPIALTATVTPADATDKKVKWSTDSSNVKLYTSEACTTEVGTDATETLTVYAKGISAGSAIVTVTSNADSTKSATCAVTVNPALPTVTITPEGAGIIEPPVFDSDRMCWNITATPATGYSFVKWTYKFNGNPKESTKGTFYATEPCSDITAVFEVSTYDISFDNGGTAKVDGTVVTSAAEGAIVTISAPEAEPGTEFNGWTSTSEGVTFEDASKATTKFTMPANEVTISASFQNIAY